MKRTEIREAAFLILFEKQFRDDSCKEIAELEKLADEFPVCDDAVMLAENVYNKTDELDNIIAKFSEKRKVDRIGRVSITVLRLALYEAIYEKNVPINVAISEAVLLSKKFSLENDTTFVNGVLGSFSRSDDAKAIVKE